MVDYFFSTNINHEHKLRVCDNTRVAQLRSIQAAVTISQCCVVPLTLLEVLL